MISVGANCGRTTSDQPVSDRRCLCRWGHVVRSAADRPVKFGSSVQLATIQSILKMCFNLIINSIVDQLICLKHITSSLLRWRVFRRFRIFLLLSFLLILMQVILSVTFYLSNTSSIESQLQTQLNSYGKSRKTIVISLYPMRGSIVRSVSVEFAVPEPLVRSLEAILSNVMIAVQLI